MYTKHEDTGASALTCQYCFHPDHTGPCRVYITRVVRSEYGATCSTRCNCTGAAALQTEQESDA